MTYKQIEECLLDAGIEDAQTEAAFLICHFCNTHRGDIVLHPQREYTEKALFDAIDKRCERYPLQYILGSWFFYNEEYKVNEHCLIPRSDTELLVEYAIKHLPQNAFFADLCTGSGCIAISTLANRQDTHAVGIDKFKETVNLASDNAKLNRVDSRLSLICADVLTDEPFLKDTLFDAVISNPPYIQSAVVNVLEPELFFEPKAALDGGDDGLVFYKKIIRDYKKHLKDDGFFLFEIGYDQKEDIEALAEIYGFCCELRKDLGGNYRMAVLKKL